jgi:hypothetical protein
MDPLDDKYTYIKTSILEGEGLFAKRDIPQNTSFAIYNGLYLSHDQNKIYYHYLEGYYKYKNRLNGNTDENMIQRTLHKYHMQFTACLSHVITLPPEIGGNTQDYNATLAHKANHSKNKANTSYKSYIDSPRFGPVPTFMAARNISKDEEILIDYGPRYNTTDFK